jgi:hypothetical protein
MPKKKNALRAASTLLPLAIGVASSGLPRLAPQASHADVFRPPCTIPFDAIKEHHPIDSSCGAFGNQQEDTARGVQNQAKNNFCAHGRPVNIDFEVLHQLQQDAVNAGITFGSDGSIPSDRSILRNLSTTAGSIGEGTVVRLAAFVVKAHYSNLGKGKGESVNCKLADKEGNDIHIVLGEKSNQDDECSSVTAEMSPHFRPDTWDPNVLADHNEHLYRFTGQLFFDASHKPCSGGKGSPKRSTIWEVHPVYAVDICAAAANDCTVDSDQDWVALSDFVGTETSSDETRLWLPDDVSSEFGFRSHRSHTPVADIDPAMESAGDSERSD